MAELMSGVAARAVVTAGMPYGNKPLHFGHIGGVFVPADRVRPFPARPHRAGERAFHQRH